MDILYKIPDNWVWTTLEQIADMTSGGTPSRTKKEYWNGNINWLKSGELKDTYIHEVEEKITEDGLKGSSAKIFPKDTLLMAMYGATVGRLGILNVDSSTNQAVCAIFNHHKLFVNEYLFFYLLSMRQKMLKDSFGGAQPNLSQGYIKSIDIPFAPLNEQKRIVAKIEKLFSNLDNSDKYLLHLEKQLKRYRQSVLKSAFEGEYKKVQWKDIVNIKNGKHYINVLNKNGKYPIYGSSGIINYADEYLCNEATVIVGRKGTINKPLFVKEKFWNIDTAFGLEADQSKLFPLYLYYFTLSFNFLDLNQSTAIPSLTKSNLQRISMSLPDSIAEQIEIVNEIEKHFSIIDKLEVVVQKSIKESKRLRQSILKQAFEGKLVEQDLNDESASILLEKIAKAKEEYQKAMKRKK